MGILDVFSGLKSNVARLRQRRLELREQISALSSERERMLSGPANKADVQRFMAAWVGSMQQGFVDELHAALGPLIRTPRLMQVPDSAMPGLSMVPGGHASDAATRGQVDRALSALFGRQLLEQLTAHVGAMQWDEGLPLAQRDAAAAEIDRRLAALIDEANELDAKAKDAGIELE